MRYLTGGGGNNFVATICWEKKYSPANNSKWFSDSHDFILLYAKNKEIWRPILLERTEKANSKYKNPDNDPRGLWKTSDLSVMSENLKNIYEIITPSGRKVMPPKGRSWLFSKEKFEEYVKDKRIWFGANGDNVPQTKRFLNEVKDGITPLTIWKYDECGHNQIGKQEIKALFENDNTTLFATPKPEALIKRIIEISTQEGDLIMDFFAGSGTTLAVAHKMNRCWIGIEQMDYIESITKKRLKKVVSGEQGGISKAVDWQGGGSFIYAELMPLNAVYKEKLLSLQGEAQAFHNQKVDSSVDCHDFANAKSRNDKGYFANAQYDKIEKELEKLYKELESKAFVDYRVDIQAMLQDREFHALSLDEKLKVLYAILDSNMDYVLYDDIDDSEYGVSEELRELNRIFYGEEE